MNFTKSCQFTTSLTFIVCLFVAANTCYSENIGNKKEFTKTNTKSNFVWKDISLGSDKETVELKLKKLGLILTEADAPYYSVPLGNRQKRIFSECIKIDKYKTELITSTTNIQKPFLVFHNNKLINISIDLNDGIDSSDSKYMEDNSCLIGLKQKYGGIVSNNKSLYGENSKYYFNASNCSIDFTDISVKSLEKLCVKAKMGDRL